MRKLIVLLALMSISESGSVPKILSIRKASVLKTSLGPHITAYTASQEGSSNPLPPSAPSQKQKSIRKDNRKEYITIYTAISDPVPVPKVSTLNTVVVTNPYNIAVQKPITAPVPKTTPFNPYRYAPIYSGKPVLPIETPAPEVVQLDNNYLEIEEPLPAPTPQLATLNQHVYYQPQQFSRIIPLGAPFTAPSTLAYQQPTYETSFPQYNFAYQVHDTLSGTNQGHSQVRNGDQVTGKYTVLDPDGIIRTVSYTSDSVNGFNAVIGRQPAPVKRAVTRRTIPFFRSPNFSYSFRTPYHHSYRYF